MMMMMIVTIVCINRIFKSMCVAFIPSDIRQRRSSAVITVDRMPKIRSRSMRRSIDQSIERESEKERESSAGERKLSMNRSQSASSRIYL